MFRTETGLYKQMEENYIGKLIEYERVRQGMSADTVCSGLCDLNMYDRLKQGEDICAGMNMMRCQPDSIYWNI